MIYADPPWRYSFSKSSSRKIENQYPTMPLKDICALPVADIAAENCVLFLWGTSPKLPEAMEVLTSWGFNYTTCGVWRKDKIGMGYYFRQQHELLLIGTRGSHNTPPPPSRPSSVLEGPRTRHSAKPESAYEAIERMYPERTKIELFARIARPGWTRWGFDAPETP